MSSPVRKSSYALPSDACTLISFWKRSTLSCPEVEQVQVKALYKLRIAGYRSVPLK